MSDRMSNEATPGDIKLKRAEQELHISWRDGRQSVYTAILLRKNCPCATCREERTKQSTELLPILKNAPPDDLQLTGAKLVGKYAIQLIWSDGHDTGIFDFKRLRAFDDLSDQ